MPATSQTRVGVEIRRCVPPLGAQAEDYRLQAARAAFRQFHAQCFWYLRADLEITLTEVPMIADGLRKNGGRAGFLLAAELCR